MKRIPFLLVSIIFVGVILACNAVPTDEPPGVGKKAEMGYIASEPVIAALEQYHADHGSYPEKLAELIPDYLPGAPSAGDLEFSYSLVDNSYSFSFHYRGPGLNTCTYKPEKEWQCSGAY